MPSRTPALVASTRVPVPSAITAALGQLIACDTTTGTFAVTIPTAASVGRGQIKVKWVAGAAPPTLPLSGADRYNSTGGATTASFVLLNQGFVLESDGVSIWTITSADLPLSALDARYTAAGSGGPPTGAAGGDLSGTYPGPTVVKVNGTSLAALGTGLLKNATGTGVPSIAVAADVPNLAQSQITGLPAALTAKADLVGGLVPTAQLPALSINEVFPAASQAAMLALTAQRGDMARRTDFTPNRIYVLTTDSPATLGDWLLLITDPAAGVDSVNTQMGAVVLAAADVGAQPVDSDLTAIAALATTPYGRGLLTLADAAALRAAALLGTAATHADTDYAPASAVRVSAPLVAASASNSVADVLLATCPAIAAAAVTTTLACRLDLEGNIDAVAASGIFNLKIKVNGTTVATVAAAASQTGVAAALTWSVLGRLFVDATGVGGSVGFTDTRFNRNAAGAIATFPSDVATAAVDVSGGLVVTVYASMAVANVGNVLRLVRGLFAQITA